MQIVRCLFSGTETTTSSTATTSSPGNMFMGAFAVPDVMGVTQVRAWVFMLFVGFNLVAWHSQFDSVNSVQGANCSNRVYTFKLI